MLLILGRRCRGCETPLQLRVQLDVPSQICLGTNGLVCGPNGAGIGVSGVVSGTGRWFAGSVLLLQEAYVE